MNSEMNGVFCTGRSSWLGRLGHVDYLWLDNEPWQICTFHWLALLLFLVDMADMEVSLLPKPDLQFSNEEREKSICKLSTSTSVLTGEGKSPRTLGLLINAEISQVTERLVWQSVHHWRMTDLSERKNKERCRPSRVIFMGGARVFVFPFYIERFFDYQDGD